MPRKNVRALAGIPLISHTIRAAQAAKSVSRIVVSTDDEDIASVAASEGAEVIVRPPELAMDDSMVMDTYFHAVDRLHAIEGAEAPAFAALLPTVPLRRPSDIDGAINLFEERQADSVISVTEAPVPAQWYRKIGADGILLPLMSDSAVGNRQEHEPAYIPNGAVYVFKMGLLRSTRQYYTANTWPYLMPRRRSVDIDGLLDFEWAEFLLTRDANRRDWEE